MNLCCKDLSTQNKIKNIILEFYPPLKNLYLGYNFMRIFSNINYEKIVMFLNTLQLI